MTNSNIKLNTKNTLMISKDNSDYLISLIIKQVQKDFAINGYSIDYNGKPEEAYESLFKQIYGVVEDMFHQSHNLLLDLLYRIDVSENSLNSNLSDNPNDYAPKLISKMILEREFKKVMTRESYGSE